MHYTFQNFVCVLHVCGVSVEFCKCSRNSSLKCKSMLFVNRLEQEKWNNLLLVAGGGSRCVGVVLHIAHRL